MLITIGAFDGFHKGHSELLELCRRYSRFDEWGVVSFFPHPYEQMHNVNHSLFTLREREFIRRLLNIPSMYVLRFDDSLRSLSPKTFWSLIRERFNVDGLVMGRDFHFGVNRSGDSDYLARLARYDGLTNIHIASLLDKNTYSSSNVRREVLEGNVTGARDILGYPYFMMSNIVHGNQRGRTMSFPTANLNLSDHHVIPKPGVYASAVLVNGRYYCGAMSIGNNPTFHDVKEMRAEVHILDFSGDIYDSELLVFFLERVRDIRTFGGRDELMRQIEADIATCRRVYEEVIMDTFFEQAEKIYSAMGDFTPEVIELKRTH